MQPTITFTAAKDTVVVVTALKMCNGTSDGANVTALAPSDTIPGRIEGRDDKVPTNLAGFSSPQLASACGCLVLAGTSTVTGTMTVTSPTSVSAHRMVIS